MDWSLDEAVVAVAAIVVCSPPPTIKEAAMTQDAANAFAAAAVGSVRSNIAWVCYLSARFFSNTLVVM